MVWLDNAWAGEGGRWIRQLSSRCTGPFRIFTLTSVRCLAGGRRGTTPVIENLSETVPASARVMQRFLTESPWDDDAVIGRLQEYLSPRLGHPEAVWVLDGSDFPKQGRRSAGVARQHCGKLGKVANCQAGMFLAYVSPLGRALVDKRLYLPESWTSDKGRCAAAGVPEERRSYRSKTVVGIGAAGAGLGARPPQGQVGCRGRRLRDVAVVPERLWQPWGCATCWTFREAPRCGPWSLLGPALKITRNIRGPSVPANPSCETVSAGPWSIAVADELQGDAWREITVAEGSQGPRSYQFSAQRVRPTSKRTPIEIHWAVYRMNLDGSEPRYYLSNAPEDTRLETLAYLGGSRWPLKR